MAGIFKLGLTGGIGSGKSTVAQLLAEYGATVVDADAVSRNLTASVGNCWHGCGWQPESRSHAQFGV